jgi:hypothetical protein
VEDLGQVDQAYLDGCFGSIGSEDLLDHVEDHGCVLIDGPLVELLQGYGLLQLAGTSRLDDGLVQWVLDVGVDGEGRRLFVDGLFGVLVHCFSDEMLFLFLDSVFISFFHLVEVEEGVGAEDQELSLQLPVVVSALLLEDGDQGEDWLQRESAQVREH